MEMEVLQGEEGERVGPDYQLVAPTATEDQSQQEGGQRRLDAERACWPDEGS